MTFMGKVVIGTVAAFLAFTLIGCGGKSVVKKDLGETNEATGIYPKDIEKLIDSREYKGAIKDVGMGTNPDKIMALKKARLDADVRIARQFEQEVSSLRKSYLEVVGEKAVDHQSEVNETFTLIKLRGAETVKELTTEGKDGYTAYVLTALSAEKLKQLIDEQTATLTEFKAAMAYKDLETRVAEEKAARTAVAQ